VDILGFYFGISGCGVKEEERNSAGKKIKKTTVNYCF